MIESPFRRHRPGLATARSAALAALALSIAAPTSGQSVTLRIAPPEGQVSRYAMHMETHMRSPMMGGSDEPFMVADVFTTYSVTGVDGDVREYVTVTDSARFDSAMPMLSQNMPDLAGQTQTLRMDTRGRIVEMVMDDSVSPEAQQVMSQMTGKGFGIELPEEPVSPGDTWTAVQTFETPAAPGQQMEMRIELAYTLESVEGDVALIAFEGPIDMTGSGAGMEATGRTTGTIRLDVGQGRLLGSTMQMTIDMNAQGMDMSMDQTMEMRLIGS